MVVVVVPIKIENQNVNGGYRRYWFCTGTVISTTVRFRWLTGYRLLYSILWVSRAYQTSCPNRILMSPIIPVAISHQTLTNSSKVAWPKPSVTLWRRRVSRKPPFPLNVSWTTFSTHSGTKRAIQRRKLSLFELCGLIHVDSTVLIVDDDDDYDPLKPVIDTLKLKPVSRLGGNIYNTLGEQVDIPRPKVS